MRRKADTHTELEELEPLGEQLTPEEMARQRARVLEAGHVGDPAWASEAYSSRDDPDWPAKREAALDG